VPPPDPSTYALVTKLVGLIGVIPDTKFAKVAAPELLLKNDRDLLLLPPVFISKSKPAKEVCPFESANKHN